MIPFRIYAYAGVALLVAGFVWWGSRVLHKANERDAAVAELASERAGRAADAAMMAKRLADSEVRRQQLSDAMQAIADRFNAITVPAPKTLIETVEVPGACPRVGLSADFVRVWNDASAAP